MKLKNITGLTIVVCGIAIGVRIADRTLGPEVRKRATAPTPTPAVSGPEAEQIKRSDLFFSDDGNYFAYLKWKYSTGVETVPLKLAIQGQSPLHSTGAQTILGIQLEDVPAGDAWDNQIAWTADKQMIAFRAGSLVEVIEMEKGISGYGGEQLSVTNTYKINISDTAKLIWFENNKLYAVYGSGSGMIWPQTGASRVLPEGASGFVHAGGGVIAYLVPSGGGGYGNYDLVVDNKGSTRKYALYSTGADVVVPASVSPGLDKICFEVGTSGSYGYVVAALGAVKPMLTGQQYSYCGRWLDNERVVVTEVPYFSQWNRQVYVYNTITGERQLADGSGKDRGSQNFPNIW